MFSACVRGKRGSMQFFDFRLHEVAYSWAAASAMPTLAVVVLLVWRGGFVCKKAPTGSPCTKPSTTPWHTLTSAGVSHQTVLWFRTKDQGQDHTGCTLASRKPLADSYARLSMSMSMSNVNLYSAFS